MRVAYHLNLGKKDIAGAKLVLLPGDPARSAPIAAAIAAACGSKERVVASKREFVTCLVDAGGRSVLVTSTGIGGPSTSIAVDELAQLGVRTFVRVGTTGAIQPGIKNGDCVITSASVRHDGASLDYAPVEYPAVADHWVVAALIEGAKFAGVRFHVGVTASSDTFYPGEERRDSYSRLTLRRLKGQTEEMRALNVLNYEMESSTLLAMTASMGLKGGCITGVVNRGSTGRVTPRSLKEGEENVIRAAVAAVPFLLSL